MKHLKITLLNLFIALTLVVGAAVFIAPFASAVNSGNDGGTGSPSTTQGGGSGTGAATGTTCKAGGLTIPKCTGGGSYQCADAKAPSCLANNPIVLWITFFINLVSVLILVGASAMLVYAGVEYISAADNPQRVQAAKQHIVNVVIGIVAYFFLFAFVQWLIPGGVF